MNVNIKQLGNVQADAPCSIIDLILKVKPEELNNYCGAKIDGKVVDLRDVVESDCEIELLDKRIDECGIVGEDAVLKVALALRLRTHARAGEIGAAAQSRK